MPLLCKRYSQLVTVGLAYVEDFTGVLRGISLEYCLHRVLSAMSQIAMIPLTRTDSCCIGGMCLTAMLSGI